MVAPPQHCQPIAQALPLVGVLQQCTVLVHQAGASKDLLHKTCSATRELRQGGLRRMGLGDARSTYLGLDEMRAFANAFRPPADIHLWVRPDSVVFELKVRVTVVSPWPSEDVVTPNNDSLG